MNSDRICGLVTLQLHYETGQKISEITKKIFEGCEREHATFFAKNIGLTEVPGYYKKPINEYKTKNPVLLDTLVNVYKDAKLKLEVIDKVNFDNNF